MRIIVGDEGAKLIPLKEGDSLFVVLPSFHVEHHQEAVRRFFNCIFFQFVEGIADLRRPFHISDFTPWNFNESHRIPDFSNGSDEVSFFGEVADEKLAPGLGAVDKLYLGCSFDIDAFLMAR